MFREYDIRGREAPDELHEESVYHIGRGFGTFLKNRGISEAVVGHDARGTSKSFHAQVVKGLSESGVDVHDIGMSTTPKSYWAQHHLGKKGLAMITASHNPLGWNGLKLGHDLSRTLIGQETREIHQIIIENAYTTGKGRIHRHDLLKVYIKDLLSKVKITKKFKVLVNTGNGTAAITAPEVLRQAGCEVIEHNTNIDPSYPNYTPNPEEKEMIEDTAKQTVVNKCDVGFAFDGDGDRMGMVDEKGQIVHADRYLILLSRLVLAKKPGAKIMFDVKVSEALPDDIKAHGGQPIMFRTGHSLIKAKMAEEKIDLAGEMSGHIFFTQDFYGFEDGVFAALKILEYLSTQDKKISEIIAEFPSYLSTPTIFVETTDEDKHKIVAQLVQEFKDEGYKVVDVDGARVYTEEGWGLVRASNTTPILVLRFEAKTEREIENLKDLFQKKLNRFPQVSKQWKVNA